MTFLNSILLAGAAAFLIPLIIHLLNRRKETRVRWGAMHLIHEVIRQKKRRLRLEQFLLLLLRILIPIILALCLARPVMSWLRSLPGLGRTSVVILLDDSFSMRASGNGGAAWERAKEAVQRITGELPRGSDVQVVFAGGRARKLQEDSTTSLDLIPKELAAQPALAGPVNANEALQAAAAALAKAPNAARELVVISDFQSADWRAFAEGAALPAIEGLNAREPKPAVTFYRLDNDLVENLSIASAELSATVAAETQPIGLRVRIKNHGKRLWQDVALHLEADGARLRTTRITVPGEGETTLSLTHAFDKTGDHTLGVRLEGDSFAEDNVWTGVVHVRNQIRALLIDGSPSTNNDALSGATDFVELALSPNLAAAAGMKDLVTTTKVDEKKLRKEDLKGQEVIILANVDKLNRIQEIEQFVKDGGGLLIFGGPDIDAKQWNASLWRNGQGIAPAEIKGLGHAEAGQNPARILAQRFTHPAVSYFNDPRAGKLQDAEFRTWFEFAPKGDDVKPLLALDRGVPLFLEKTLGRGRVIVCATSANAEWTNLPLQMVFVPLVQRLVSHLATQGGAPAAATLGQPVRLGLSDGKGTEVFELTDPSGKTTEVKARKENNGVVAESAPAQEPGVYSLKPKGAGDDAARKFAFNVDPAESDLHPLAAADLGKITARYDAGLVDSHDSWQRLDHSRRHGSELWQPFLVFLLLLLFAEVLLAQRIARA